MQYEKIKFRGIRLDNGKDWAYGSLIPLLKRQQVSGYAIGNGVQGGVLYALDVIPGTIGQFTGINDINGKPVYEGDIVRYRTSDDRYTRNKSYSTLQVCWDDYRSCWSLKGEHYCLISPHFYSRRIEVVGNVHENPDIRLDNI